MFILLTGRQGAGKTTACWKALPGLRSTGVKMAGFVAPPLLNGTGDKTGIEMLDLSTGEHQTFARLVQPGETPTVGVYRMSIAAIEWARRVMSAALLADVDWLVIDEIGPLELYNGGGFAFALEPLSDPVRVPNAIVIVREGLVDELGERLGRPDMIVLTVSEETRATIPALLVRLVEAVQMQTGAMLP
jgi:nucleoside-triphosphatase THEP1